MVNLVQALGALKSRPSLHYLTPVQTAHHRAKELSGNRIDPGVGRPSQNVVLYVVLRISDW